MLSIFKMYSLKSLSLFIVLMIMSFKSSGSDTAKCTISINYYHDLSDTYGGGNSINTELKAIKSWYGGSISLGFFHAQPTYLFNVPIEEYGLQIEFPFDELSYMHTVTISGNLRPITEKWITTDLYFGFIYGRAKTMNLKGVDYKYDLIQNKLKYLIKDYQLVKKNHLGYQFGVDVSFNVTKRFGFQVSTRIQDLSNGGTFFFAGGGLLFKL